jgi:hypothetical protein
MTVPLTARIVPAFESSRHLDRTIKTVTDLPMTATHTPVVRSRSLGALLGFASLAFKLETCQPTGSWLDRSALGMVERAVAEGATGVCLVGSGPLALPLAVQCARAGLTLVVLYASPPGAPMPDAAPHASVLDAPTSAAATSNGWLAALGARENAVAASPGHLGQAASAIARRAGLWPAGADDPPARAGLEAVVAEVLVAIGTADILAVPGLTGHEEACLAAIFSCPASIVGRLGGVGGVSVREADAARVLLAREEGLIASQAGAAALAALIRAVRDDRARRPREQRFPRRPTATVVLTGDPPGAGSGPARASDAIERRSVSLGELERAPVRWLLESPDPQAGEHA